MTGTSSLLQDNKDAKIEFNQEVESLDGKLYCLRLRLR